MAIGIIGAGRMGSALAAHFTRAGYAVVIANSRGPESLAGLVQQLGSKARAGTAAEAAAEPIVVLAVRWSSLPDVVAGLGSLAGKIVIDPSNPITEKDGQMVLLDHGDRTSSEIVAELVPGAKLVKAFNTLFAAIMASPTEQAGGRRVVCVSGDHEDANAEVQSIIATVGWAPLCLGDLVTGGRLQQPRGPLSGANLIRLN
jgi:8-hydroxy-5-deazaflavin:NADPH oxidoreductase